MNEPKDDATPRHAIRVAAQRSGIPTATLRAWERRYGAVRPARSETERRLYSDGDIVRLRLMRDLVQHGHTIGHIARLSLGELEALLQSDREQGRPPAPRTPLDRAAAPDPDRTLEECSRALRALDGVALRQLLTRATLELGPGRVIDQVIAPLCRSIGAGWQAAELSVAHEHLASIAVRNALGFLLETLRAGGRPRLIATTPAGERHELGAMMAAVIAAGSGWDVTYLGPDMPAADLAVAASTLGVHVVLLGLVMQRPEEDVGAEVRAIRAALDDGVAIVAGGPAAHAAAPALREVGAELVPELADLPVVLGRFAPAIPSPAHAPSAPATHPAQAATSPAPAGLA